MADVTIKYKGAKIAEMSGTSEKTIKTGGTYCEEDISVTYAPRVKSYDITLAKASGWVLLTTLDVEVLEHINDASFIAVLVNISPYAYEWYAGNMYIATNIPRGYQGNYPAYGMANREQDTNSSGPQNIYYPANNTATNDDFGGLGAFRVTSGKYYLKPRDGFIKAGTYRLIFTW